MEELKKIRIYDLRPDDLFAIAKDGPAINLVDIKTISDLFKQKYKVILSKDAYEQFESDKNSIAFKNIEELHQAFIQLKTGEIDIIEFYESNKYKFSMIINLRKNIILCDYIREFCLPEIKDKNS